MSIPLFRVSIPHLLSISSLNVSNWTKSKKFVCSYALPYEESVRSEVSLLVGTHVIPHPSKIDKGGEDAFFVSNHNGGVIAVADGVSGWAEKNIDPSQFSQELMANASSLVVDDEVNNDPQVLLRKSHAATSSIGSATVIVAMLEKSGILKIASVGDCGLKLLREGQIVFSTSPQEHYFDCPYQLSSESVGQSHQDAMVCNLNVVEGDIVVVGSDGLFDNVFDHEIISTISKSKDVAEAAKELASLASSHSMDVNFESPYSLEARSKGFDVPFWKKILGMKLIGGKLDDITVVVGRVVSSCPQILPIESSQDKCIIASEDSLSSRMNNNSHP